MYSRKLNNFDFMIRYFEAREDLMSWMRSNLEKEDQKFEKCEGVSKVLGDICNTITKINEKDAKKNENGWA